MARTPRSHRKEESRERILDAAARAVRRGGFRGVAVAEVMSDAGLTHGGFYAHFSSRDALLSAALGKAGKEVAESLGQNMARLKSAGLSPFRALVESYLYEGEIANRDAGCPVAALCSEVPTQTSEIVHAFRPLVTNLHRLVAETLPEGHGKEAAWTITSSLVGAVQLARALGDGEEGRAILAQVKQEILARYDC